MKKETTEGCGSKGYEQQFDRQKESLGAVVGGAEKDVQEEARQAVKEVKARAREHIRRTRDYADKARKMGCGCASDARKQARRVKEEIREEVREAKKTIKGRVERFRTGEDTILSDIENQPTCRPDLASIASHMESDGDYRATDDRGTRNNYTQRVMEHTEGTKERIRQDVADSAEDMQRRVNDLYWEH